MMHSVIRIGSSDCLSSVAYRVRYKSKLIMACRKAFTGIERQVDSGSL